MKRAEAKASPKGKKVSPTEALLLLLPYLSAHDTAARLTTAVHTNDCRLWCNGNLLSPDYIAKALMIVARTEADGRWRADVVGSTREAWEHPLDYYRFEFDASQVQALLPRGPGPTSDLQTDDKPRRSPGPVPEMKWRTAVAREVIRLALAGRPMPKAPAMLRYCQEKFGWEPSIRAMQAYLRDLLA